MRFLRLRQRFAAWLALLAMLTGALAPTLAQAALAGQDRAGWVEVCSATGMVWVQADEAAALVPGIDGLADAADDAAGNALVAVPGGDQAPGHDADAHCPWCSLHGGATGLPPTVWQADLPAPAGAMLPAVLHAASLTGVWALAHARAPPLAV